MHRAKSIEEFFEVESQWQDELLQLREILTNTELEETIKWGMPSYGFGKRNLIGIGGFKNWFCLWFHEGALLADPHSILINAQEGKTQGMRQWRMKSKEDLDTKKIRSYIDETIAHFHAGREVIMMPKTKVQKPSVKPCDEWVAFMKDNPQIAKSFKKYTDKQQAAFIEYISEAKQVKTRLKRLERVQPLLEVGQPVNALWS